jgi:hypothetical protein
MITTEHKKTILYYDWYYSPKGKKKRAGRKENAANNKDYEQ